MNTTEIVSQLKPVFEKVAEKIGSGAEFGWFVVMKQQYVVAVQGGLEALGGVLILGIMAFLTWKLWRWIVDEMDGAVLMIWIFSLIPIMFIVEGMNGLVTHLLNPQYYALQFFLGLVK